MAFDYLKENDWWIRAYHYATICNKLNITKDHPDMTESSYFRDVYVWLPDVRWGNGCMPSCSNLKVRSNGFRENHVGRRVITLDGC